MSNDKYPMSIQDQNQNVKNNKFDLGERTAKFGEAIIDFLKNTPESTLTRPIIIQLIRSATSIGANYMEADCAESKKDFKHKIGICKKESKETTYWLRMLARTFPNRAAECRYYWQEAHELTLIFSKIINNINN